jgi:hypothetical protein
MEESSIENNIERNQYGGWYVNGKEFSTEKKVECEETHRRPCAQNGRPPSIRAFAKEAKVSRKFAKKMMEEIKSNGHVVSVESLKKKRHEENPHLRGAGAQKLSPHEKQILIDLRHDDPSRSNIGYVAMLHQITGTKVSKSFITNFFKEIGPYKAKLRKVPMIPIDKYRPKNIKTYQDYLRYVSDIPIHKIKFGDEKSVKGHELWSKKARPDPFTGQSPPGTVVPSDFRNTYTVIGFCCVDPTVKPMHFTIGQENNASADFMANIINAAGCGWLKRGDFLVVDNARVHSGGDADNLQDILWYAKSPLDGLPLNIFVIPFPTRSPELNPIELLWNTLVQRINRLPASIQLYRGEGLKIAAIDILKNISTEDVLKTYNHCGYY